ncbi:uncharacterized protein LOC133837812 [Drosophila sulfurigaster albostrigata]|uniref:uncharacterized protein LOC133837812 n=1 Tax=Drosophila sulfurigaster albostrigata TaxID=89887 RepID=UPI002D2188F2|nr:uncharacterized protein LOC133837812 [Drosophila sulfurigaster albostrigata]
MCLKYIIFLWLIVQPVVCAKGKSFDNTTSCEKAKQPKFISSCCNIQKDDAISKSCRKSLLSQNKTTTNNGDSRNLKTDKVALHACIAECVFKQNGYLLANGSINLPVVQSSLQQRYRSDPALAQLIIKSLNTCLDSSQNRAKQFEWLHTKDQCDYYPATLLACTMEQVYINCPASKWKNTDNCVAMQKFLVACDARK